MSARLAPLVWSSAVFLLPRSDTPFSAVTCMSDIRRRYNGRLALNMIKSGNIFAHKVDVPTATFAVWTRLSSKGRPCAPNSRLASRETGDGLTDTDSGGSLNRTESVARWSRERRACPGRREAPGLDKAVSSSSLTHPLDPEMYWKVSNPIDAEILPIFSAEYYESGLRG